VRPLGAASFNTGRLDRLVTQVSADLKLVLHPGRRA
jgi:hypothetical protein